MQMEAASREAASTVRFGSALGGRRPGVGDPRRRSLASAATLRSPANTGYDKQENNRADDGDDDHASDS